MLRAQSAQALPDWTTGLGGRETGGQEGLPPFTDLVQILRQRPGAGSRGKREGFGVRLSGFKSKLCPNPQPLCPTAFM